jgi:hypothetical protein
LCAAAEADQGQQQEKGFYESHSDLLFNYRILHKDGKGKTKNHPRSINTTYILYTHIPQKSSRKHPKTCTNEIIFEIL